MLDSSIYSLSNPALNDDIGETNLNQMLPASGGYVPGITGSMSGVTMQGSLKQDRFEPTRKEKDNAIMKNILSGAVILAGGFLIYKGGKKVCKFVWQGVKSIFNKIKSIF